MAEKTQDLSLSGSEKISLISNLSTMLSAGIPILEAVDSMLEDARGNPKKILQVLRDDLIGGNRIFATFSKFPLVFDKVTINVVKAAEESGTLDITLRDLQKNIQKNMEFSDRVKGALIYPAFLLVIFFSVLMLMLTFVIPRISEVFLRLRVTLPLPTKIMIFASTVILKYTLPFLSALFLIGLGLYLLYENQKKLISNIFFSLPLVSGLVKEIDLTRFSRSLYLLLYAGIPITMALDLAADVVNKREMEIIIKKSREMVLSGKKLSEGFRQSKGYFPMIMVRLIEAGEKTGSLDKSMLDISEYYDYQVSKTLKALTSLLEPVMLVIVGVVIGGMMLSIISPIYGMIGQVGGQ